MTNEETAINILNQRGYHVSAAFDEDNYREVKNVVIKALNLADESKHRAAIKLIEPLDEGLRAAVKAVIEKKSSKQ